MKRYVLMGILFVLSVLCMAVVAVGASEKGMAEDPIHTNSLITGLLACTANVLITSSPPDSL